MSTRGYIRSWRRRYPIERYKLIDGETDMSEDADRSPNAHPPPLPPVGRDERPACVAAPDEEAECPLCNRLMRLWAGFYRCPNCGYKESCCF
jgi:hypothetical protein